MAGELERAFGQVIRELREAKGLSQEQLSFACGRHRTYISLIERGKNSPSIATLWMLAAALDSQPSDILRAVEKRSSYSANKSFHPEVLVVQLVEPVHDQRD